MSLAPFFSEAFKHIGSRLRLCVTTSRLRVFDGRIRFPEIPRVLCEATQEDRFEEIPQARCEETAGLAATGMHPGLWRGGWLLEEASVH